MIVKEFYAIRADGISLYRTYSNEGKLLLKIGTNEIYNEAIDIENSGYEYIETEESKGVET